MKKTFGIVLLGFALLIGPKTVLADARLEAAQKRECELTLVSSPELVIVGAYSGGADIPEAIRLLAASGLDTTGVAGNVRLVQIHPQPVIPDVLASSFVETNFAENLTFDGTEESYRRILASLRGRNLVGVLAGTETSIGLTDRLATDLGQIGNSPALSPVRREKSLMQERIRASGLRSIPTIRSSQVDEILAWVRASEGGNNQFPIVVKPLDSAATQGVHICQNIAEVEAAARGLLGSNNIFNDRINEIVVQQFARGTEYAVNFVSRGGQHLLAEVWRYKKELVRRPDGTLSPAYAHDELVPNDDPVVESLRTYGVAVLNALELREGPSHMELMYNPEQGPVLIEVAGRLMGGHTQQATREALGTSPIDQWMLSILRPTLFEQSLRNGYPRMRAQAVSLQLISHQTGTIVDMRGADEIRNLPSTRVVNLPSLGDRIEATTDMANAPGSIWLVNRDRDALWRDYARIRQIEERLFVVSEFNTANDVVIIVGGYSSGSRISQLLLQRGLTPANLIHVHPDYNIPSMYEPTFQAQNYSADIRPLADIGTRPLEDPNFEEAFGRLQAAIAGRNVRAVITGAESGTLVTDAIAFRLGVNYQNRFETSLARRDKDEMQMALARAAVASIPGIRSGDISDIMNWVNNPSAGFAIWPVVIKPLSSAGTQGVSIAHNEEQLRAAHAGLIGTPDLYGRPIQQVLVQRFLHGTEYVVNTVSLNGETEIVEVIQYEKGMIAGANGGPAAPMYMRDRILPLDHPIVRDLGRYAFSVLRALGVDNGPAHMEIMMTPTGPILVELGARLGGGYPLASRLTTGRAPVDALVESLLAPDRFSERLRTGTLAPVQRHAHIVQLISTRTGVIREVRHLDALRALPSYQESGIWGVGRTLLITRDLDTSPGTVLLAHPDPAQLEADYRAIRAMEADMFVLEGDELRTGP